MNNAKIQSSTYVDNRYLLTEISEKDHHFSEFTYQRWHFAVTPNQKNTETKLHPSFAAIAAWRDGAPVGLVLLHRGDATTAWRLCSVRVASAHRRRGIGCSLLLAAERLVRDQGGATLIALHTDAMTGREGFEACLRRAGWPPTDLYRVRLAGHAAWMESAERDWAAQLDRLRQQGWHTSLWGEMDADDLAQVDRLLPATPELLRPLKKPIFAPLSLALRRHGQVVGWIQAIEDNEPGHVYYEVGYVIAELQRGAWLIAGLLDACRRQRDLLGPHSVCHYETSADNRAMQTFMLRRLAGRPGLIRLDRQFWSEKDLS